MVICFGQDLAVFHYEHEIGCHDLVDREVCSIAAVTDSQNVIIREMPAFRRPA